MTDGDGRDETAWALAARLVEIHRAIGARAMHDLPIYNPRLDTRAVGFRPHRGWVVGILVTPWFMNLVAAARPDGPPLPPCQVGDSWALALPAATVEMLRGDLDGFGRLDSAPLFSPMGMFDDPAIAATSAQAAIETLFTPGAVDPDRPPPTSAAPTEGCGGLGRRALLFGGGGGR